MTKSALLILAEGAEEMEAIITADVLRRAGIDVCIGGLTGTAPVKCSRNVVIVPDKALSEVASSTFDAVVLPGGLKGADALANSKEVGDVLKQQESSNRIVAAICAAPIALKSHNIGASKKITSHPTVKDRLGTGYQYVEDRVVVDGNVITSRGPGTAFEFALALVSALEGEAKAKEITGPMLLK